MSKYLIPLDLQLFAAKKDPPEPPEPPAEPEPPKPPKGDDTPPWAKQLMETIQKLIPSEPAAKTDPTTIPAPKPPQRKEEDDHPAAPEPPAQKKPSFWDWLM